MNINKIAGMGYVKATKTAQGVRLFYVGTRNEVYPGERFASIREARMFHAIQLIKAQQTKAECRR